MQSNETNQFETKPVGPTDTVVTPAPVAEQAETVPVVPVAPEATSEAPYTINPDKLAEKLANDKALSAKMAARELPATGNANATISDPFMVNVEARYNIVQNQSDQVLIVPDMKTNDEDMGLVFQPGEVITLADYYSPQEINRSKGLRHAATKMVGVGNKFMLIPLNTEEEGVLFKVPEKVKHIKGSMFEDTAHNDFDDRFAELEAKEAKREEKLLRKTLAGKRTKQHGQAPSRV